LAAGRNEGVTNVSPLRKTIIRKTYACSGHQGCHKCLVSVKNCPLVKTIPVKFAYGSGRHHRFLMCFLSCDIFPLIFSVAAGAYMWRRYFVCAATHDLLAITKILVGPCARQRLLPVSV